MVVVGGFVIHRHVAVSRASGSGDGPPFAVRWTSEPLGKLTAAHVKVSKSAGLMTVFDGDKAVKSYRVISGSVAGDKQREGDKRTPEGPLRVCMKNPHSKYVLSLGLDYPDPADAARGLRDGLIDQAAHDAIVEAHRTGRQPPWNTALGGEIMIHGCKGKRTGTLGCISMDDDAIRELYPAIDVGTPVTILP